MRAGDLLSRVIVPDGEDLSRFLSRIKRGPGCWEWIGPRERLGYGLFIKDKRKYRASRVSYALYVGTVPDHLSVCHHCDNPSCVRPDHLFLGTQRDNMMDAVRKYGWRGGNARGERHPMAAVSDADKERALAMHASGVCYREVARRFGVCRETVINWNKGKYRRSV